MAYGATTTSPPGMSTKRNNGKRNFLQPIDKKTKSIKYSATVNNLLLDLAPATDVETNTAADVVSSVKVRNDGYVPALAIFQFYRYTDATTEGAAEYIHFLLNPSEEISMPATRAIIAQDAEQYIGTAVDSTAPNANEYTDSTADIDTATSGDVASDAAVTTIYLEDGHSNFLRAGDLIRLENEILEVLTVGTGADLANSTITVKRGVHGSTAATHADDVAVRFPFFNAYHDFDTYTLSQTDNLGRWKSYNFFGYGRAASAEGGLMPGSIAIQFYSQGKAVFNLSDITSNTESGLTASTSYEFDITVDGGTTFDNLSFTTDSSNLKFGGSTGIVAKIQDALDTQYYTAGNLFEKKVTVGLEGGDLVFRSGSFLAASAIAIGAGSSGTAEFLGTGRIPSAATSIDARIETETITDPITNGTTYKQIFIRDDGMGNLIWKNTSTVGTVNYETGAIDWTISERPNAEFVVSVLHTSAMSGKLATSTSGANVRLNSLRQVLGNTPQQKCEAKLTVTTY